MTVNVDTTRAFRRPSDLQRLVLAVVAAHPADEAHWIEWKCPPVLKGAESAFRISKQILGFANRSPDTAARFAEGTAYVILGAEPGQVSGLEPLDFADLEDSLAPYLGSDAPLWSPAYVEIEGKSVLVITVDAPRWGDPIYLLCKTYQGSGGKKGADDGTVFIRRKASTQRVNSAELCMLQERLKRGGPSATLALQLQCLEGSTMLRSVDFSEEAQNRWLKSRRKGLLEAAQRRNRSIDLFALTSLGNQPDQRSFEEYATEVDAYLKQCADRMKTAAAAAIMEQDINRVRLQLTNPRLENLPNVEVEVYIPGRVASFDHPRDASWLLPEAPWPWGKPRPIFGSLPGVSHLRASLPTSPIVPRGTPILNIKNGGSCTLTFSVGDVRPGASISLPSFTLLVTEPPNSEIVATWKATSTRVDDIQEGSLTLHVAAEEFTFNDLLPV